MSSSRKRTEHIERIRYPNPLPLPPYPPKLLSIATPSSRYADPRTFGTRLATAHPLPVVVDSEAGMPLNMTDFPQAWYTDQELEADENIFPTLESADIVDEEDAFLLSDLLGKLPSSTNNANRGVAGKEVVDKGNVTWLRRTEYLGAEKKRRERELIASRYNAETIDSSRAAQLKRIRESFSLANASLASIRHPTKPGLKAVEEHQLLPDAETWASRYDVFRYGDPPGRTVNNKPTNDPRLQAAILRPHKDLLERDILSLFLVNAPELEQGEEEDDETARDGEEDGSDTAERRPAKARKLFRTREEEIAAEDEATAKLLRSRKEGDVLDGEAQNLEETDPFYVRYHDDEDRAHLNYIRDYEPHDEVLRKDQEVVLTFIEKGTQSDSSPMGDLPPAVKFEQQYRSKRGGQANGDMNGSQAAPSARKVVYYHPVSSRASLRVRRRKATDPRPPEHWDAISLGKRSLSMYEKIERLHERKVVDDFRSLPDRLELPQEEDMAGVEVQDVDQTDGKQAAEDEEAEGEEGEKGTLGVDSDAANEEAEEADGETAEGAGSSDSGSESGSDNGTVSDEAMDEDELAALQEDAGEDEPVSSGPGRRSRRRAASPSAATQGNTDTAAADPAEDSDA